MVLGIYVRISISVRLIRYFHLQSAKWKTVPTNLKGKSKGSQEWLIRQMNDPYVKKAHELNYRARSAFKLIEIDGKFKLLKKGMTVVELGAAPGSWSQVVIDKINADGKNANAPKGKLIGVDLLPIEPLVGAIFLSGSDFTNPEVQEKIRLETSDPTPEEASSSRLQKITPVGINLILSDMAPNASGIPALDAAKLCSLVHACLQFATRHAQLGSHLVAKVWDGSDAKSLEAEANKIYKTVSRIKPRSSRENSSEFYLVAQGKKDDPFK